MSLLMSYAYRMPVGDLPPCHLMLDSGAFTAISQGTPVTVPDLAAWYAETPAERRAALDVVYDPVASRANALRMREGYGLDVIPVVHPGTPSGEVDRLSADGFRALAIGGTRFGYLDRDAAHKWIGRCLTRAEANGMEVHGFAYCPRGPKYMPTLLRFASVDVSSWTQANKYGVYAVWDGGQLRFLAKSDSLTALRLLRRWPVDVVGALTRERGARDGRSWMWYVIGACSYLLYGRWLMDRGGPRVYLAAAADTLRGKLPELARVFGELEAAA